MHTARLVLAWILLLPAVASAGGVRGRVVLDVPGTSLVTLGPTVVYLEAEAGTLRYEAPDGRPEIRQRDATFDPSFLVVAAGQRVWLPNDDTIYHNVFSYSKPNDFDLGLYPRGETRSVLLDASGVVRIYCSIHESMNAVIFVAPSPWFALADASGAFEIRGVPPGRYRVATWNDRLPSVGRVVDIPAGSFRAVDLPIAPDPSG